MVKSICCSYRWPSFGSQHPKQACGAQTNGGKEFYTYWINRENNFQMLVSECRFNNKVLPNPVTSFDYIGQAEWGMWPGFYTWSPFSKHTGAERIPRRKHESMQVDWRHNDAGHVQTTGGGFGGSLHFYSAGARSLTPWLWPCLRAFQEAPGKKYPEREIWSTRIWEGKGVPLSPY